MAPGSVNGATVREEGFGSEEDRLRLLVRAAAAGDQHAWAAIVRRFERHLWAIARAHRLSDDDAADVVQITWLRLLEHLTDVQSPERIGAWLSTTARRAALGLLSSARRQVPSGHTEVGAELLHEQELDARLVADERARALWAALAHLPPRRQVLLRLLAAEPPPTYEQISAELDMPIGSIGPTRARALAQLHAEFERLLPVPGAPASPTLATV